MTDATSRRRSTEERFWSYVDCWEWLSFRGPSGHGRFGVGRKRVFEAHRWAWEHLVGPIPDGYELDHLCRNRPCVNPDHLEPVLPSVNTLRGESPHAKNARKTHCPKGHPYAGDNLKVYRRPGGTHASRYCRACEAARHAGPPKKRLTTEDVARIRELKASGLSSREIAERFGITPLYVNDIVAYRYRKVS